MWKPRILPIASMVLFSIVVVSPAAAQRDEETRRLFDFEGEDARRAWQTVNDGVMGGRSDGRFRITEDETLQFFGNLSLANNGGFASVRSRRTQLNLSDDVMIVAKVRGDGRQYTFNLYPNSRRTAFSYRITFDTIKDEWVEVRMPLDRFVATSFGRTMRNQPLNPDDITGVGILLGDKKPGSFRLEVDWIEVRPLDD